jgi:hypothetical protein
MWFSANPINPYCVVKVLVNRKFIDFRTGNIQQKQILRVIAYRRPDSALRLRISQLLGKVINVSEFNMRFLPVGES